jgi:hypothetical protein
VARSLRAVVVAGAARLPRGRVAALSPSESFVVVALCGRGCGHHTRASRLLSSRLLSSRSWPSCLLSSRWLSSRLLSTGSGRGQVGSGSGRVGVGSGWGRVVSGSCRYVVVVFGTATRREGKGYEFGDEIEASIEKIAYLNLRAGGCTRRPVSRGDAGAREAPGQLAPREGGVVPPGIAALRARVSAAWRVQGGDHAQCTYHSSR